MAASHTLPQVPTVPQISRSGTLTLYGFGIRVTMQAGHLQIDDGIGPERHRYRLPRVDHRLKRLVCIGEDGFITLSALKWLTDVGASFIMLDRLGKVRVVTGPASPSEARLRRSQALALSNGRAVPIARELIGAKLGGQETVLRDKLKAVVKADAIATLRESLLTADTIGAIRATESRAALDYWGAWYDVPVQFPRKDAERVPTHWLRFGARHSPLTGGPRLAVGPGNALLNYTNAVAGSECRLALVACGLDPGLGFIHTDTANRDSLGLDLIETIRPAIEAWLLNWLLTEPLRRADFAESTDGSCRLSSALCSKLSETAPTWRKLVAPWAEYIAHSLTSGRSAKPGIVPNLKTPMTQRNRREAKGAPVPKLMMPKAAHRCRECGKVIRKEYEMCGNCATEGASVRFADVARIGRIASKRPESRAKHSKSARKNALACWSWDPSDNPSWLTEDFFSEKIQPVLARVPVAKIKSSLGVSRWYAWRIRKGYRPHPRHWRHLADVVGISASL